MASKFLFFSKRGKNAPATNAVNEAGGRAYQFTPRHALAQYAATGCLNSTYYATADEQLDAVTALAKEISPEFIARTAIYARQKGFMKDMPALLCAIVAARDTALLGKTFPRVVDNSKMLRNFVQIVRSGATGRKSLGTAPKRLVREWLESRNDDALFRDSVGDAPSLADVVKMVHPKPASKSREALYGWLLGREYKKSELPGLVRRFEEFKESPKGEVPNVPFQMLTALELGEREWKAIARNAGWQMTRMNLNTFARHGVLKDKAMVKIIAERLRDGEAIRKARVFPYQLMAAYLNVNADMPLEIREALQDAMEIATDNVPAINGKVFVFPDVSGSMSSAVTGARKGATSKVRCIDVAALVAASVLRKNPSAEVIPFEQDVAKIQLNPRDSVMTNAQKLSAICGGGTNCSAPLRWLNKRRADGDLIIYVSDNESWVDKTRGNATATMVEWKHFKSRNPNARMACIDVQPYGTTQAAESGDILNIGGFSDSVFQVIREFATGGLNAEHWIGEIEKIEL